MTKQPLPKLSRIIEQKEKFAEFNDFDAHMEATRSRLPDRETATGAGEIAWLLYELARDHFFMMRVIGLKLAEIGRAYLSAKEEQNASVQVALGRAFIEHSASLAYQADSLAKAMREIPKKPEGHKLRESVTAYHRKVHDLFYGSGSDKAGPNFVNVLTMIDYLEKKIDDISLRYGELSEYVHPNYGSNRLVSGGTLGTGYLSPSYLIYEPECRVTDNTVEKCAAAVIDYQSEMSRSLIELDSLVAIAATRTTKETQIFSIKSAAAVDGQSRQTAITFPKARTHLEQIKAKAKFLEENRIVLFHRQILGFDEGYLIEVNETSAGRIWFRFRVKGG